MSRHYIVLPAALAAGSVGIVCGYDRAPFTHFFLNVSDSLSAEHIAEPVWASMFDTHYDSVQCVNGFDAKLASFGITLPESVKLSLQQDYDNDVVDREVWWNSDGTKVDSGR